MFSAQGQDSVPLKVLHLNKQVVDTLVLMDSIAKYYLVQSLNDTSEWFKLKKTKVFRILPKDMKNQWVEFRFEDEFLVDDIFIPAKVLAYNQSSLLLEYEHAQSKIIASVHKSQIAQKDLNSLRLP